MSEHLTTFAHAGRILGSRDVDVGVDLRKDYEYSLSFMRRSSEIGQIASEANCSCNDKGA